MAPTTRERLRALHAAEPHLNQSEIADRLSISRQRVSQIAAEEGLSLEAGKRGIVGRGAPPKSAAPERLDAIVAPASATLPVAVMLTAADLARRGFAVFVPVTPGAPCDLVAIDAGGRVEQVVVSRTKRGGKDVRYDSPENDRKLRRALIMTGEPVQYSPALRSRES